ncbi:MAG: molybdenum cofactor biosynthesis protein MoeA [Flavobacteriales bacterium]|nr:MAG: molybdenum cofactor biosynthesis protein MoeA [Flavobacteriales bacterium]
MMSNKFWLYFIFNFIIIGGCNLDKSETMMQTCERFESWIAMNANQLQGSLNEGASQELIQNTEKELKISFPQDFKDFYMIHNGQKNGTGGLIDMDELLSLEEIVEQWSVWHELLISGDFDGYTSEPSEGIKNNWWNDKWIPITHDGGGNHICMDLDPASGGRKGQIIQMWHDSEERELIATSFSEWIQNYVDGLETGAYRYSNDWGGIINKADADVTEN